MLQTIRAYFNKSAIRLRDALILKYPVTHLMMDARQEERWIDVHLAAFKGKEFISISEALRKADLGISRSVVADKSVIDLSVAALPFILSSVCRMAASGDQRIYVFEPSGKWTNITNARFKRNILKPVSSGRVEIAIVGPGRQLVDRISINIWKERAGFIECSSPRAPIKRVSTKGGIKDRVLEITDYSVKPIDVVYTWVNSADSEWQKMLLEHKDVDVMDRDRFEQCDELRYSLRSVRLFAPWVRTIYVFSNCKPPDWFQECSNVKWVYHHEVIPLDYLPVFNSHSIETFLHLIPGISDQFIYFNDDFFLSGFVHQSDFFTAYGASVSRLEPYGGIPYLVELKNEGRAEEWQSAAVNGSRLLADIFGRVATKIHRHAPYAIDKQTYKALTDSYPNELESTRRARFRTPDDLSFTSFLYHHFALNKRLAVESNEDSIILRTTNYRRFLEQKLYLKARFYCMNDGGGSSSHVGYRKFKSSFPASYYPFKTEAEN